MTEFSDLIAGIVRDVIPATPVGDLRTPVDYYPQIGRDAFKPLFGPAETYDALVEFVTESVPDTNGVSQQRRVHVTIFQSVPVKEKDEFVVPNGAGGMTRLKVQRVNALLQPDGTPYMVEVVLN
jgi:hypothetical protein